MSTENITTFFARVESNPALAGKLAQATAHTFATVAQQEGLPFTADELLAVRQGKALSDEALSSVAAGGFWDFLGELGTHAGKTSDSLNKFPRL